MSRRRGFTLIELLVVIAIIGILASMVFPVFARARESARKVVCLSNVKNIALAIQMYLADNNDTMMPYEHRAEVHEFLLTKSSTCDVEMMGWNLNPYLRVPVVLDEYVKNRDVWRCPSAKLNPIFGIINPRGGDWLDTCREAENAGEFTCYGCGACHSSLPPGWGGSVTDSYLQQRCASDGDVRSSDGKSGQDAFQQNYGMPTGNIELKLAAVQDPVRWIAITETGGTDKVWEIGHTAYPDVCKLACSNCNWGPAANWTDCPWTIECGVGDSAIGADPQLWKQYARHLGGVNIGFLDGHAAWINSQQLVERAYPKVQSWYTDEQRKVPPDAILGINNCRFPMPGTPNSK